MKIFIIQFINYTLSFVMWMILGRMLLTLIIGDRQNVLTGLFKTVTDPVYWITRRVIPFADQKHLPWLSILLVLFIRIVLIIVFQPSSTK